MARFEKRGSEVASALAGRGVTVECTDPNEWRALSYEHGFDPALAWALTPLRWEPASRSAAPGDRGVFSPRACRLGARFLGRPTRRGARLCRHGSEVRRVARSDDSRARRTARRVPIWGECDIWGETLVAVHVLTHESMHLAGVVDEAGADCLALQLDAFVAMQLGADARFARAMAREYWRHYYPSQDSQYRSPSCRDAGALDLFPGRIGWPAPNRYPARIAAAVARMVGATTSSDEAP